MREIDEKCHQGEIFTNNLFNSIEFKTVITCVKIQWSAKTSIFHNTIKDSVGFPEPNEDSGTSLDRRSRTGR